MHAQRLDVQSMFIVNSTDYIRHRDDLTTLFSQDLSRPGTHITKTLAKVGTEQLSH